MVGWWEFGGLCFGVCGVCVYVGFGDLPVKTAADCESLRTVKTVTTAKTVTSVWPAYRQPCRSKNL